MREQLNGFIKLNRSLLGWEWSDDPDTFSVWVHLLLMANHKPTKYHGMDILPGQIVTGRKELSRLTGVTDHKVRTALERLKTSGCVSIKSSNRNSVISLVNWGKYQLNEETTVQQNVQQTVQQLSIDRPATVQQPSTYEECKNVKNVRSNTPSSVSKDTSLSPKGTSGRRFKPPTVDEVAAYCFERNNGIDAEEFVAFYESKGWMVGKSPMKSWKGSIITWEKRRRENSAAAQKEEQPYYAGYDTF